MNIVDVQAALWILIQAVQAVWSAGYELLCGEISRSASLFVVLAVLGNLMICPLIAYFIKANPYLIRCISNWFFLALFLNWTMFKSSLEASFPMVEEYVSICCLSDKTTQYSSLFLFPSYLIVLFFSISDSTKTCNEMRGSHSIVYFRASYYPSCYFLS